MENNLWTLSGVAQYLGVSKNTVYTWAKQDAIPAVKVGRQWRFSQQQMTRWVKHRRKGVQLKAGVS